MHISTSPGHLRDDFPGIRGVPESLLHGPARWALVAAGYKAETYVYRPYGAGPECLNIWLESLADQRPDRDGRVTISEWRADWRYYYIVVRRWGRGEPTLLRAKQGTKR